MLLFNYLVDLLYDVDELGHGVDELIVIVVWYEKEYNINKSNQSLK